MNKFTHIITKNDIIVHLLFLVLGGFAIIFYQQRLIADSGYYLFQVINNEAFRVEHNRFILIFSQLLPLIGVKLGLELKYVLYLYSIGHILFFYVIFLVARYHYKDRQAGILLLMLQTVGITSGFFVPMFELYYCAGLLVLFSVILNYPDKKNHLLILIVLAFFILTGHPYSTILILFVVALNMIDTKKIISISYIIIIVMIIVAFIFKKFTASEYEMGKTHAFIANLINAHYGFNYIKKLASFMYKYYLLLLVIELITLVYLMIKQSYFKALLIAVAFFGTLLIINISYFGFVHSRYQEQVYFSLSFVVAYPFVKYLIKNKNSSLSLIFTSIAVIAICIGNYRIWAESNIFINRTKEIKAKIEIAEALPGSKFIVKKDSLEYNPNWSYPIETILFSSYGKNVKTVTICTDEDMDYNDNKSMLLPTQYLFRRWEIFDVSSLNKQYFKLDNSKYVFINN